MKFLLIALALCLCSACQASPLSIGLDLGNEWLKVCLINEKAPPIGLLDVVVNEQSNRKTPSLVGVDGEGERVFGEAAVPLTFRAPARVFPSAKRLLGQKFKSSALEAYQREFSRQHHVTASSRGGIAFHLSASDAEESPEKGLSVEEIVSTIFRQTKKMVEQHATVQNAASSADIAAPANAVITVAESFSPAQRLLIKQLASLSDVQVQVVLNDLTAVAIDYAVRVYRADGAKTPRKVIFFSVGSSGSHASLVEFTATETGFKVNVLATASQEPAGGLVLDLVLQDKLARRFDEKYKQRSDASNENSIFSSRKAMNKLLREARETKEQMSTSPLFQITLEELFDGKDFQTTVTKEDFDSWVKEAGVDGAKGNLIATYIKPIADVLTKVAASSIQLKDIHSLELYGGGVRLPHVPAAIKEQYPSLEIGKHVDGDEAAMLGAAYYANQLRGKKPDPLRPPVEVVEPEDLYPTSVNHLPALTDADLTAIKTRLAEAEAVAALKRQWDAAKNELEAYVVDVASQLSSKTLVIAKGDTSLKTLLQKIRDDILDNYDTASIPLSLLTTRLKELQDAVANTKATVKQPESKKSAEEDDEDPREAQARNAEAKARRKREKEKHRRAQQKQKAAPKRDEL